MVKKPKRDFFLLKVENLKLNFFSKGISDFSARILKIPVSASHIPASLNLISLFFSFSVHLSENQYP
jgi:hypothetical protein